MTMNAFDLEALRRAKLDLEKSMVVDPVWVGCVLRPTWFEKFKGLTKEGECKSTATIVPNSQCSLMGMHLFQKTGQVAGAWIFRDRICLHKYLNGEMDEWDLLALIESGETTRNEFPKR